MTLMQTKFLNKKRSQSISLSRLVPIYKFLILGHILMLIKDMCEKSITTILFKQSTGTKYWLLLNKTLVGIQYKNTKNIQTCSNLNFNFVMVL